jgi:hypothetical protein
LAFNQPIYTVQLCINPPKKTENRKRVPHFTSETPSFLCLHVSHDW